MARAGRPSIRDRVRQRAEENKHTGGSGYLKLPEGVSFLKTQKSTRQDPTRLDIVPFEVSKDCVIPDGKSKEMDLQKGDLWYCRTIFVHRNIGAEEKAYICPRTIKKPCPICEERARLSKNPNADEKTLNALKPQVKDIFNINDEKEGIQILEFSHANFRQNLEKEIREGKEEWAGFADLEGGFTLEVVFSEETFGGNKYLEATRFDFEPRDDYKESILDKAVDLNDCLVVLPYDKLERIFLELDSEPESEGKQAEKEEEEEEKPARASRKAPKEEVKEERSSRRAKKEEPEPEPEEEEEEEEEEKPPVKEERAGRRGREREEEPSKKSGKEKNPCPHGYTFGEDTNAKGECQKCDTKDWEACQDKYDELHPRKGKK